MAELTGKQLGLTTIRGKLLTIKEVAAFLRVSVRWVNDHISNGTFPFKLYPIGERNRGVDSADLDEWLSKIAIEAGAAILPLKAIQKIKMEVKA